MRYLLVDDDAMSLKHLEIMVRKLCPDDGLDCVDSAEKALELAEKTAFDAAFLDIEMPVMNGLTLAHKLHEHDPELKVVFVTGNEQYAIDAFKLHVDGYIVKPVNIAELEKQIKFIKNGREEAHIFIQTFNGFDVMIDNEPIQFHRAKAKELLALLVDRRGATINSNQGCAELWPDAEDDESLKSQYRTMLADLKKTLEEAGIADILVKGYNALSIDVEKVECDYFKFLDGDGLTIHSFNGSYMPEYDWAEVTLARLEDLSYRFHEVNAEEEERIYKMEERRGIRRIPFEKKCLIIICKNREQLTAESVDASPLGMGVTMTGDTPELLGEDIIIIAPTMIMYAEVVRQTKKMNGKTFLGIKAKEFTDNIMSDLYEHIGSSMA